MWVSASAMFSVPRVTMKGGSRRVVTSPPFSTPKPPATSRPTMIDSAGARPLSTASLVMKIDDSAMTRPQERSMPAVRMTSVWPMARVPSTITCCSTSEKFVPVRNRSDLIEKKMTAIRSAATDAPVETSRARSAAPERASPSWAPSVSVTVVSVTGLAPAVGEAELHVLALDAVHRLGRDQVDAGVVVAGHVALAVDRVHDGVHALGRHLEGVLLRGGGDLALLDGLHAGAAAVDGDQQGRLARLVQRVPGAEPGRLVDRVDEVDVRVLLEAVLHRGLALGQVALGVLRADDLLRVLRDPEAREEAVVAQVADGDARVEVHHGDDGGLALHRLLRVLADQLARSEVVGGEQRVGRVLRVQRGVERDHLDALVARLLDHRDDRRR